MMKPLTVQVCEWHQKMVGWGGQWGRRGTLVNTLEGKACHLEQPWHPGEMYWQEPHKSLAKENAKSCIWDRITAYSNTGCWDSSSAEKDLGVLVDNKLNVNYQCALVIMKANLILRYINKTVARRSKKVFIPLYLALWRPHLYCVQLCMSQY